MDFFYMAGYDYICNSDSIVNIVDMIDMDAQYINTARLLGFLPPLLFWIKPRSIPCSHITIHNIKKY